MMRMRNKGFSEATGERLTQVPDRLGHLCEGRRGFLKLCFQSIEPLVKAVMKVVAQCVPLFSCTDLLKRDNLSCAQRWLLVSL